MESEYKTKNRAVKRSTRRDKRSYVEKLTKSAEERADMAEVYKITKGLVNTNTKAEPPFLDLNGNILSTDEEKLNKWREHFESAFNHVVSSEVPPFGPTTESMVSPQICMTFGYLLLLQSLPNWQFFMKKSILIIESYT